jgi:hypothetical protein
MKYNNEYGGGDSSSSSSSSSNSSSSSSSSSNNDNSPEVLSSAKISTVIPTGHDAIPVETPLFIPVDLALP